MDRGHLLSIHLKGLEEIFSGSESFVTNGYNLSIGHLVVLLVLITGVGLLEGFLVVEGDEAELFLDVSD